MIEENLERTFAADPYDQMGGYIKRMRGVDLAFKAENPKGQRIERLFLEGRPANDGTVYAVRFIPEQGVPARFGTTRRQLPVDAIATVRTRHAGPCTLATLDTHVQLSSQRWT